MKTKVEIEGYEIEIEFSNGVITVKAEKDEEIVEEFSIDVDSEDDSDNDSGNDSEDDIQDEDDVKAFDKFKEEEDFEDGGDSHEDLEDSEDDDDDVEFEDDDDEDIKPSKKNDATLESFQSFIKRKK